MRPRSLPPSPQVKPDQGVSTLVCPAAPNAKAVYTGWNPATKRSVSVATTWSFGKGVVVWIGSGYTQPNLKGYAEVRVPGGAWWGCGVVGGWRIKRMWVPLRLDEALC